MEFFNTHVAPGAFDGVRATLESTRLSEGVRVKAFEQALADDLGQLQDADERLAPTLPIPDRPTAAPNARAESTPNHAAASQRERS